MGYKATGMMFGCLTAGVLLAVGHHLFYASIDQEFVQSSTQQQWFSRYVFFSVDLLLSLGAKLSPYEQGGDWLRILDPKASRCRRYNSIRTNHVVYTTQ